MNDVMNTSQNIPNHTIVDTHLDEEDFGFCSPLNHYQLELIFYFMSIPAFIIIAVLNLVKCSENGWRFRIVLPINLHLNENRLMYSLALGSTTSIMVELVKETEIFHWQKQIPHELSVFVSLLICWYFGYLFSPIFVAINAGSKLSHILGLIYSLTFGTIICLKTIPCAKNQRSQIMSYCRTIPATTCAYSVSVGFGILLYLAIRQKAPKCLLPKNILGFRYPLPVVLGVFMAFQLIYQCAIMVLSQVERRVDFILPLIFSNVVPLNFTASNTTYSEELKYWSSATKTSLYVSIVLASVTSISGLLMSLKKYSTHIQQVQKGNFSEVPQFHSPAHVITDSCKYVGFQMGYGCWGFIVQVIVFALVCCALETVIIMWHRYDMKVWTIAVLNWLWPMILPMIIVIIFHRLLITLLFVAKHNNKRVLAIQNLYAFSRSFCTVQYYLIFLNAAVGLFACVIRILLALVFGLFALPTLNISTMARPFESCDEGFLSYVAMLHMENTQNNIVLRQFVDSLVKRISSGKALKQKYRYKNMWNLAVTLHRNPALIYHRIHPNRELELNENHKLDSKF